MGAMRAFVEFCRLLESEFPSVDVDGLIEKLAREAASLRFDNS